MSSHHDYVFDIVLWEMGDTCVVCGFSLFEHFNVAHKCHIHNHIHNSRCGAIIFQMSVQLIYQCKSPALNCCVIISYREFYSFCDGIVWNFQWLNPEKRRFFLRRHGINANLWKNSKIMKYHQIDRKSRKLVYLTQIHRTFKQPRKSRTMRGNIDTTVIWRKIVDSWGNHQFQMRITNYTTDHRFEIKIHWILRNFPCFHSKITQKITRKSPIRFDSFKLTYSNPIPQNNHNQFPQ